VLLDPISKLSSESLSNDSRARFLLWLLDFLSFFLSLAISSVRYVIWSGSPLPGLIQGFFAESKGFVSLSFGCRPCWTYDTPWCCGSWMVCQQPCTICKTCRYVPSWGSPSRALPQCVRFPFLGTCSPANLAVAATLAMLARAASCLFTPHKWEVWQDVTRWY